MGKHSRELTISEDDKTKLEAWVRAKTTPQRVAFRARVCLLAAEGLPVATIAETMNTSRPTVLLWKKRFEELGPEGLLQDAPRGPSPRKLDEKTVHSIIDATVNATPPDGSCWTTRTLAKVLGVSNATVARIWKAHGIRPKRKKPAKSSKQKGDGGKGSQLLALFIDPPVRALICSSGTNSGNGKARFGSDYGERAGSRACEDRDCSPCLFAAIGLPVVNTFWNWRPDSVNTFTGLLKSLEQETPEDRELHLILDDHELPLAINCSGEAGSCGRYHVHVRPMDFLDHEGLQNAVLSATNAPMLPYSTDQVHNIVRGIEQSYKLTSAVGRPFVWKADMEAGDSPGDNLCKAVTETIRDLGFYILSLSQHKLTKHQSGNSVEAITMNWKQRFESWFAAAAFAEEGEHLTALHISETVIPEPKKVAKLIPALENAFAAVAFAEENCPELAIGMLAGKKRRRSFLEEVGLVNVRVWYAKARIEPSFTEIVGLTGAPGRLLTVRI